jgi:hypothetical protein
MSHLGTIILKCSLRDDNIASQRCQWPVIRIDRSSAQRVGYGWTAFRELPNQKCNEPLCSQHPHCRAHETFEVIED